MLLGKYGAEWLLIIITNIMHIRHCVDVLVSAGETVSFDFHVITLAFCAVQKLSCFDICAFSLSGKNCRREASSYHSYLTYYPLVTNFALLYGKWMLNLT